MNVEKEHSFPAPVVSRSVSMSYARENTMGRAANIMGGCSTTFGYNSQRWKVVFGVWAIESGPDAVLEGYTST